MPDVLHLRGPVRLDADDVRDQAWVLGRAPDVRASHRGGPDVQVLDGWVLPGPGRRALPHRPGRRTGRWTPPPPRRRPAPTGTPARCWSATRARRPTPGGWTRVTTCHASSGPAATSPAAGATSATSPWRSSRRPWWRRSATRRAEVTAGSRSSGTGSTGTSVTWRPAGPPTSSSRRSPPRTRPAPGSPPTASPRTACPTCWPRASTASSTAPASRPTTIERGAARGVAVVPTLVNIATFPGLADAGEERFPTWSAHMRRAARPAARDRRRRCTRPACRCSSAPTPEGRCRTGSSPTEVAELVAAGLPAAAAVGAASWDARRWLGRDGLVEGARADLVVLDEDPLLDPATLRRPRAVVLGGHAVVAH